MGTIDLAINSDARTKFKRKKKNGLEITDFNLNVLINENEN
jgi:hypothetical protein